MWQERERKGRGVIRKEKILEMVQEEKKRKQYKRKGNEQNGNGGRGNEKERVEDSDAWVIV